MVMTLSHQRVKSIACRILIIILKTLRIQEGHFIPKPQNLISTMMLYKKALLLSPHTRIPPLLVKIKSLLQVSFSSFLDHIFSRFIIKILYRENKGIKALVILLFSYTRRSILTTDSICVVCANISTGCTSFVS